MTTLETKVLSLPNTEIL